MFNKKFLMSKLARSHSIISSDSKGYHATPQPPQEAGTVIHAAQKGKWRHRDIEQVKRRARLGSPVCLILKLVLFHPLALPSRLQATLALVTPLGLTVWILALADLAHSIEDWPAD